MELYSEVSSVTLSDEAASVVVSVVVSEAAASEAALAVAAVPLGAGKLLLHLIS